MKSDSLKNILNNMPSDWLRLTTHRLDIYNESLAKSEFLSKLQELINSNDINPSNLASLPTAFDYIRLGHPLSCLLEWSLADQYNYKVKNVVSFSSPIMPILAVLRRNLLMGKSSEILWHTDIKEKFQQETIKKVYGYSFDFKEFSKTEGLSTNSQNCIVIGPPHLEWEKIDSLFKVIQFPNLGSVIFVKENESANEYIKEILHVRRRESIAMTPQNCLSVMQDSPLEMEDISSDKLRITINSITKTNSSVVLGSCGLSVQYAIMMGLIDKAQVENNGKKICFIVPPNCYGGTNDQARRVAACLDFVSIVDLPVDSGKEMSTELDRILESCAQEDVVPYIIAEIPTNPRVEIPDLIKLREVLNQKRKTPTGHNAVSPLFILDQTFCPNVEFFGVNGYLKDVDVISYVSGSKFPSGGLCTAGYAVGNGIGLSAMEYVQKHLEVCGNEATRLQVEILENEMPSMNERIEAAYKNTRAFVNHIRETLPQVKINFVSEELAKGTFTPSVFSLDLPSSGNNPAEREKKKRELNHKLIKMMISGAPDESKHCVSYGQLKGCYWTIPATSTQGTTKETDKDYIVRVSVAPEFDLDRHKEIFNEFVKTSY